MERFIYINGTFKDRISNTPEQAARYFHARIIKVEPFEDPVCGPSEKVYLIEDPSLLVRIRVSSHRARKRLFGQLKRKPTAYYRFEPYATDIYTVTPDEYKRVKHLKGLTRCQIPPDQLLRCWS